MLAMGTTQAVEGRVAEPKPSTADSSGTGIVYRGDADCVEYMIEPASKPSTADEDLGRWRSGFGALPSEEVAMQEDQGRSVSEERETVLQSMGVLSDALTLHEKPAQDDTLPRRKRLCPNWRSLQPTGAWTEPVLIDHETCDVVLDADEDVSMDEEAWKAGEFAEPRTPNRSPVQTHGVGAGVDEQLLSCFLGSYTAQHSLLAKAQAARTQKLAAVATNFGGSFAAHAAAKQIVKRNACESCGGFGARCMDCPDWQPNAVDNYIECPDRERPAYRTAGSTRPGLNAPVSCVLPR
jgi:hypothetical protein